MQKARVLSQRDIKEILADYFSIPQELIITTKYSYIILEKEKENNEDDFERQH